MGMNNIDVAKLVELVEEQAAEIEQLQQASRPVPTYEGGPGKEDSYWIRAKLRGAVTHLRDIEDYYRTLGGLPEGINMIRADRARSLYEQISDDFINGQLSVPTMRERAERAEAERDALRAMITAHHDFSTLSKKVLAEYDFRSCPVCARALAAGDGE